MRRNLFLTAAGAAVGAAALIGAFIVAQPGASDVQPARPAGGGANLVKGVPTADRAVYVQAVSGAGTSVLSVSIGGRVGSFPIGGKAGERELFTVGPHKSGAGKYVLKTAYIRVGGEPSCLTERGGKLFTNACDPSEFSQCVQFVTTGAGPNSPTFDLVVGGNNVEIATDGTVSTTQRGQKPAATTFGFVDGGPVTGD
jgi:hypothetical protein